MQLSKKEARIIQTAIQSWTRDNLLSTETSQALLNSYEVTRFDWKRVAKYSFWLAIVCILISVSAALADQWLMALLQKIFSAPIIVKCITMTLIAAALYFLGTRRKSQHPEKRYSNEAVFFLGVLATAAAIAYFGKWMDTDSGHFSLLLLLAAIVYGVLGLWFPSKLVWVFALLSMGSWFGAETGYASGWGAYYLGMNYPMRFVLFGLLLLLSGSYVFNNWPGRAEFLAPTRAMGLLYLFIALWILSIFGNYSDPDSWLQARQIELFHWSLLFALAAIVSIWHGLRYDDGMTRGFGISFIFINLYTRYFEYFWDSTHKAVFFAILALSFWYLGSRAEKIWYLEGLRHLAGRSNEDMNGEGNRN